MDETKIRIISDTLTFYPIQIDTEARAHQNDNMTLSATLAYMKHNMHERMSYFTAGNETIVIQTWNQMLFFIQSTEYKEPEVLKLMLQTIREMLFFLFGKKFETVMKNNVSMEKRQIFAKYVDKYLSLCDSDYLYLLNSMRIDNDSRELAQYFVTNTSKLANSTSFNLISALLYKNHQLVGRYDHDKEIRLESYSFMILSLFENVEYDDIDNDGLPPICFNPEDLSIKFKTGFFIINDMPLSVSLTLAQTAPNSPFVIVIITNKIKAQERDAQRSAISNFMTKIIAKLSKLNQSPLPSLSFEIPEQLIHFLLIDRKHGNIWELPLDSTSELLSDYLKISGPELQKELDKILTKMACIGMTAMLKGFTSVMYGELDFHFSYELRFEDDDGDYLKPENVFKPPKMHKGHVIDYRLITKSLFEDEVDVTCYELFSIYCGNITVKTALASNSLLFEHSKAKRS